jgi:AraC-like DNA-binding protein
MTKELRLTAAMPAAAEGPGLRLHYVGRLRTRPAPRAGHPHWTAPWFAILQCAGMGGDFLNDAGVRLHLRPGDVWTLVPGLGQRYGPPVGEWWDERIVAFDGWLPRRMLEEGTISPQRPLATPSDPAAATACLDAIIAARDHPLEAVHWTYALISLCCRGQPSDAQHPLARLAERMRREPERDWDMQREASALGMRYHHLRQEFRRRLGSPPQRWLLARRIDRMASLLVAGHPVGAAAKHSGLGDPNHASRLFARLRGQTPSAFATATRQHRTG